MSDTTVALWSPCCRILRWGADWPLGTMHDGHCRLKHHGDLGPTVRLVVHPHDRTVDLEPAEPLPYSGAERGET